MSIQKASDMDGFTYDDFTLSHMDKERKEEFSSGHAATEEAEAPDKIVCKPKLSRTPPQRRGSLPDWVKLKPNSGTESSGQEEEVERRSKRRREDGKNTGKSSLSIRPLAGSINSLIKLIEAESKIIATAAREKNTKKEIKEAAGTLTRLMSKLVTTEVQERLRALEESQEHLSHAEKENTKIENLTRENEKLRKENEQLVKEKETLENNSRGCKCLRMNEELLKEIKDYQDFRKVEQHEWPDELFKATHLIIGSPMKASRDSDLAILMEEGDEAAANAGIRRVLIDRFPDVMDLEGTVTALTINTKLETRDGPEERVRHIYKVEIGGLPEWFDALKELRKRMIRNNRKAVAIYPPAIDQGGQMTRKYAEAVFRGSGLICTIYIGQGDREPRPEKVKPQMTESVLVSKEGKTYAELLKEVRVKVAVIPQAAKSIKTIRRTKDGDMVIVMDKKEDGAMIDLKEELHKIVGRENIKTLKDKRGKQVVIKDMDEITTKAEVLEAIKRETGARQEECWVGELRPCYGNNQAVTARLPPDIADRLLKTGNIKIGLNSCLIMERLTVQQCYRCWGYGHLSNSCKGEDMSRKCRKCGEQGHKAQNCQRSLRCLLCKEDGHAAGSGECPEFKKALVRVRQLVKAKRSY